MPETTVDYDLIPAELRSLRRWVLHRVKVGSNGKKQKVPYQRNGEFASSTNPATWTDFASVVPLPKGFDGISFAMAADDGLVCIDLDGCRAPESGDIEPWAETIVEELNSYTEISPSGTGLHIFVRGTIPKNSHRQGSRLEIYRDKKTMATTGNWQFGTSISIEARDLAPLFARAEAGEFAPQPSVKPKVTRSPLPDESSEDFRLVAEIQRKVQAKDADTLEAEFRKAHPERYAIRNRQKGGRNGQSYFRYTIENFLKQNPPEPDEPEIKEEDEIVRVFPRLPGALGQLVEAVGPDLPYEHRALAAVTYIGVGISRRVRLLSDPWLQPRFYSCMVGESAKGKSASDIEMRRALFGTTPHLFSDLHVEYSADSGPALIQALAEHPRMILAPDEMAFQFEKARTTPGSKSSLFGEFLRLYEGNITSNLTKFRRGEGGRVVVDADFAILGSATTREFENMWVGVRGAASGLQSRFVLSYSEAEVPVAQRPNNETEMAAALFALNKTIGFGGEVPRVQGIALSTAAQKELEDWGAFVLESALPIEARIIDMAKRFALLLAACAGAAEVDVEAMRLGVDFAEYQVWLRSCLYPEDSSSSVQAFENRIISFYSKHPRVSKEVAMNFIKPDRWPGGFEAFNRAFLALARAEKLVCVGKSRKGKPLFEIT